MAEQSSSPSLLRRQLGRRLRGLREGRGESLTAVAEALEVHPSVISRLETGQRPPGMLYVDALCRHYELDEPAKAELVQMARDSRQSGWWEPYKLAPVSKNYIGWESAATAISNFEVTLVPGLLQTPEYARAIIGPTHPDYTPQQLATEVKARVKRQQILEESHLQVFHAILDESVLVRRIGSDETMRAQLRKLIAVVENPKVVLQVMPFAAGASQGLDGPFSVLSFADGETDDLIYAEGALGALYEADVAEVAQAKAVFRELAEMAASQNDSISLIEKILDRH
ncbi:helix-turn-helix transcriptional regulator [Actinoplanes sp. NPDC023714]|uniref:helix-turn-helix domain-containing protein n=1 Tax=Actinoplanes sp. NPDC023714 TaxID=3154322 RepID=UPI00340CEB80